MTCVLGIGSYFIIVDFPEKSPQSWRFLNEAEAAFVVARIEQDRSDTIPEPFSVKLYLSNALDSKVWAFAALYMLTTTCSYSIAYFLPIILEDSLGFSVAEAQCLTAPPYVAAAIVMFTQAFFADRWRVRGPVVAGNAVLGKTHGIISGLHSQVSGVIGLSLLGYAKDPGVRYFGVFLATTSCK